MSVAFPGHDEEFSQMFIDGMGDGTREFVPIVYGQTADEVCG